MAAVTMDERVKICDDFIVILKEMMVDWGTDVDDNIGMETDVIGDLGFVSIDMIQLAVAIESHFQRRDFQFDKLLMRDGRYVDALYVRDIVSFLQSHLNSKTA